VADVKERWLDPDPTEGRRSCPCRTCATFPSNFPLAGPLGVRGTSHYLSAPTPAGWTVRFRRPNNHTLSSISKPGLLASPRAHPRVRPTHPGARSYQVNMNSLPQPLAAEPPTFPTPISPPASAVPTRAYSSAATCACATSSLTTACLTWVTHCASLLVRVQVSHLRATRESPLGGVSGMRGESRPREVLVFLRASALLSPVRMNANAW